MRAVNRMQSQSVEVFRGVRSKQELIDEGETYQVEVIVELIC